MLYNYDRSLLHYYNFFVPIKLYSSSQQSFSTTGQKYFFIGCKHLKLILNYFYNSEFTYKSLCIIITYLNSVLFSHKKRFEIKLVKLHNQIVNFLLPRFFVWKIINEISFLSKIRNLNLFNFRRFEFNDFFSYDIIPRVLLSTNLNSVNNNSML